MNGRGAWTKTGMPPNGTGYYQLLSPINVGSQPELGADYLAVNYGVKAIQKRIGGLGLEPRILVDGKFGQKTHEGLLWAQNKLGVAVDGQFGPRTSLAFFWPRIQSIAGPNAKIIGGITAKESAFDPGAIGYLSPEDHGLVQINAIANPTISIAQAFDHNLAFIYCANRFAAALLKFNGNVDCAIAEYNSPAWAEDWFKAGHPPNPSIQLYVDKVKAWVAPN